ncbi:MAG TPA: error-prone DNA polymerase [Casimicrobiaceae bacterium]|nr:error-prone DNA polymerase [Casimicrobiaceae bacterium]
MPYAELHCISNFTFLRGASHPEELVARAHELGYAALAITDECSLAGVVRAHVEAKKCGLRLLIGSEFRLDDGLRFVLLATDRGSYGNLAALITRGRRSAVKGSYRLTRADIADGVAGCLALWLPGCSPDIEEARWLATRFTNALWIAAERLLDADDATRCEKLIVIAAVTGLPITAAGDVHMHVRERRSLQDTLTAIRLKTPVAQCGYALHPNGERHLRPLATLERLYPSAWLAETLAIAKRCRFSLDELRYEYPEEIVPAGETPTSYLRRLTEKGFEKCFPAATTSAPARAKVRKLIEHELALIAEARYEAFFLTVYDIVEFAREKKILCQGRGSAANSAVCYCLGITAVDPSRMEMLFERFISRERNEPPDIDVDFEHQRREEVIQYIYGKYTRERAGLTATVICYRPRSALRDVGKALGLDLSQVDRLAKSMTWWDGRRALKQRVGEAGFDARSPVMQQLFTLVNQLLGFPRHLSQHTGGFVISRGPLSELVPVENAAMPQRTVIEWDKDDLDALGLLKVDVLALGMLSAIRRALELISVRYGRPFGLTDVPAEDPAVYEMIGHGDTVGVFQIESRAQMAMLPRLKPKSYYDLVIEVAIVRPGPIQGGMVHPYLRRRQGIDPVSYPSEAVKSVLERTLGVPIFQEQVMQLAVVAAGFTPGESDQLRRSMAAWKRKGGLEPFERRLIEGMRERGYEESFARQIYQQILGFGEYGFPESHSASFALLVYVSSWIKHYKPAAFTCALLNSQPMGFYSPSQLTQDLRRHGATILPADATVSEWDCTLEENDENVVPTDPGLDPGESRDPVALVERRWVPAFAGTTTALRLGLCLVKGLSQAAGDRLVATRREQPFHDVADLARRAKLNRHDLEALAAAGALAGLSGHRRNALWDVAGIERMPPVLDEAPIDEAAPSLAPPGEGDDIVADYASLGLTLGRHPVALLRERLQRQRMFTAAELKALPHGRIARMTGLVTGRQRPGTASGVTFVTLEDETGMINVIVWRDLAERQRKELLRSSLLTVYGTLEREGEVVHLIAGRLRDQTALLGNLVTRSRDFH